MTWCHAGAPTRTGFAVCTLRAGHPVDLGRLHLDTVLNRSFPDADVTYRSPFVSTVETEPVVGQCTGCGSIEVVLDRVSGHTDLSAIGESAQYPFGYGCELCS